MSQEEDTQSESWQLVEQHYQLAHQLNSQEDHQHQLQEDHQHQLQEDHPAVVEEDTVVRVRLTNTTEEPRTVSVWVAEAVEAVGGGTGVGGPLDWITVDAPESIDLAPLEERDLEVAVDLASYLEETPDQVLFMLENRLTSSGAQSPHAS